MTSAGSQLSCHSRAPLSSARKEGELRHVTWRDVRLILPTALILLFTLVVLLTVIPHAFSTVLRQLEAVKALEASMAATANSTDDL